MLQQSSCAGKRLKTGRLSGPSSGLHWLTAGALAADAAQNAYSLVDKVLMVVLMVESVLEDNRCNPRLNSALESTQKLTLEDIIYMPEMYARVTNVTREVTNCRAAFSSEESRQLELPLV